MHASRDKSFNLFRFRSNVSHVISAVMRIADACLSVAVCAMTSFVYVIANRTCTVRAASALCLLMFYIPGTVVCDLLIRLLTQNSTATNSSTVVLMLFGCCTLSIQSSKPDVMYFRRSRSVRPEAASEEGWQHDDLQRATNEVQTERRSRSGRLRGEYRTLQLC